MLTNKNSGVRNSDSNDLFNKKKLADEAKRENVRREEQQKQQEKNKLQTVVFNREQEVKRLNTDLQTKQRLLQDLKIKVAENKKHADQIETELKELGDKVIPKSSVKTDLETGKIQKQRDIVKREKLTLQSKKNNAGNNLKRLEVSITSLKTKLAQVLSSLDHKRKELNTYTTEISSEKTNKTKLEQEGKGLDLGLKQSTDVISLKQKTFNAKDSEIKKQRQQLMLQQREAGRLEVEESELSRQRDDLRREIQRLTIALQDKEKLQSENQKRLEEIKRNIFLLEAEIKKEGGEEKYLDYDISAKEERGKYSEIELEKNKREQGVVEQHLSSLEKKRVECQRSINDLELQVNRLQEEVRRVSSDIDSANAELVRDEKEIGKVTEEEKKLDKQYEQTHLIEEKSTGKNSVREDGEKISKLKLELTLNKRHGEELGREILSMKRMINNINRDKELKEREIAELKRKRDLIR